MPFYTKFFVPITAILTLVLALLAHGVNYFYHHFPGNNYFPVDFLACALILIFSFSGIYLLFNSSNPLFQIHKEFLYYFLVVTILAFATNGIQYTPFPTIDIQLIKVDKTLGIDLTKIMAWWKTIPWLKKLLVFSYESLPYQMCYLPIILIFARKFSYLREYYSLLILSALVGFSIYYFFPTTGPASVIVNPYFDGIQYQTGKKFYEIHHHLKPTTQDGGLIAMPSFHIIWAWLGQYLSRCWPMVFIILLPINLLLSAACLLLGWHYFIDLLVSFIILIACYAFYFYIVKKPHLLTQKVKNPFENREIIEVLLTTN